MNYQRQMRPVDTPDEAGLARETRPLDTRNEAGLDAKMRPIFCCKYLKSNANFALYYVLVRTKQTSGLSFLKGEKRKAG